MNYDTILVTHRGPIAVVAWNRPDKLNAMTMMLKAEVVRALHDVDADEHTRTIVLTGSGENAFTAGADIHEFQGRTAIEQWRMYPQGPRRRSRAARPPRAAAVRDRRSNPVPERPRRAARESRRAGVRAYDLE